MRHPGISSSLAGEQAGRGFLPVDPPGRKPIGMTVCSGIGAAEVSAPWIDWRGKPADFCPDGPRYKALGNSWAVNCGQYVFDRIQMVEAMT